MSPSSLLFLLLLGLSVAYTHSSADKIDAFGYFSDREWQPIVHVAVVNLYKRSHIRDE
jgi:hypothetical protein